ncbi:MAG: helix-hairpin-helix domain-containing protein [Candidatus Brocadiaceae bacterium]|nr:helix-hairpin-helix domain-containing protein [Candidatus Brocadiaceae bacterium]
MAGFQHIRYADEIHKRSGRKPKRISTRKLHLLQGLPGVGPRLAGQMLEHFGSIEKVIAADEKELAGIGGIGKRKVAKIREIVK